MRAQTDGCLIVKEYSPDEWHLIHETTYVDMDDDGEYDFRYGVDVSSSMMAAPYIYAKNGCCFHALDGEYYYFDNVFYNFNTQFNDSTLCWSQDSYGTAIFPEHNWVGHYHLDTISYKSGIRNGHEGEYYYGWMEAYAVVTYNYDSVWFYLARTGYCTIPNYPLLWGQTEVIGVEENSESYEFATIHPNPTHGMVTIICDNLHQAEVVNMLGQQVLCKLCKGKELQIDMTALPAGIYFVNITDELGRKCVHKVVKE
jgi:hypothetical protein